MHLPSLLSILPLLIAIPATSSLAHIAQPQAQIAMSSHHQPDATIYFAYGSNLWLSQMSQRCPTSQYIGIARLSNYTWLINSRGYANVAEVSNKTSTSSDSSPSEEEEENYEKVVYGLAYTLQAHDESRLDKNEGVPIAYTKEYLKCDFWSAADAAALDAHDGDKIDTSQPPTNSTDMLVYIDKTRVDPDVPREEYVYRMNRGIEDALGKGVPGGYVEKVVRKYIPEEKEGEDGDVGVFAREQAKGFRDESGVF